MERQTIKRVLTNSSSGNTAANKICDYDSGDSHCFLNYEEKNTSELRSFMEDIGGVVSYGFDECSVQHGHMNSVLDRIPCWTILAISIPNKVL
jgi:hypothetical protein